MSIQIVASNDSKLLEFQTRNVNPGLNVNRVEGRTSEYVLLNQAKFLTDCIREKSPLSDYTVYYYPERTESLALMVMMSKRMDSACQTVKMFLQS